MKFFLILHIKLIKNNYFLNFSNSNGKMLFIKNAGILGFTNINKRSIEVFKKLIFISFEYLMGLEKKKIYLFLKIEGFKKYNLRLLYKECKRIISKKKIKVFALKVIHKIPHNGCRKRSIKF